jgi:hypothetical protein
MNTSNNVNDRYPIGEFIYPENFIQTHIDNYINIIQIHPVKLREETGKLTDEQLDTPYRDGGWTIRQVVHHLADSHMNSYIRFKLAVTEDTPVIKPYLEEKWAETIDGKTAPAWISLNLLDALHFRWVLFLNSLKADDFKRTFYHPQQKRELNINEALALYSWHCQHHLAHITSLKNKKNW